MGERLGGFGGLPGALSLLPTDDSVPFLPPRTDLTLPLGVERLDALAHGTRRPGRVDGALLDPILLLRVDGAADCGATAYGLGRWGADPDKVLLEAMELAAGGGVAAMGGGAMLRAELSAEWHRGADGMGVEPLRLKSPLEAPVRSPSAECFAALSPADRQRVGLGKRLLACDERPTR